MHLDWMQGFESNLVCLQCSWIVSEITNASVWKNRTNLICQETLVTLVWSVYKWWKCIWDLSKHNMFMITRAIKIIILITNQIKVRWIM